MKLYPENIFHIYNRGNDSQTIFFGTKNYKFFLEKMKIYVLPHCDIISYCLMPNHFHFMVYFGHNLVETKFAQNFRTFLSSYTRAINLQEKRTGSLFQQNTKAKGLSDTSSNSDYGLTCFNYIHQNPLRSGLVRKMEDWEFSSFREYLGLEKHGICNLLLARELINIPVESGDFYTQSYELIRGDKLKYIF